METILSHHAARRMKQRGICADFLAKILEHADIERPANDNCRLYRVTKRAAQKIGDDRLARFAVIWSDDSGMVVTVARLREGRPGRAYRHRQVK